MPKYTPTIEADDWHASRSLVTEQLEPINHPEVAPASRLETAPGHEMSDSDGFQLHEQLSRIYHTGLRQITGLRQLYAVIEQYEVAKSQPKPATFEDVVRGLTILSEGLNAKSEIEYVDMDAGRLCVEKIIDGQMLEAQQEDSDKKYVITSDETEPRHIIALSGAHENMLVWGYLAVGVDEVCNTAQSSPDAHATLDFNGDEEGFWIRTDQGESWEVHEMELEIKEGVIFLVYGDIECIYLSEACQGELKIILAKLEVVAHPS